jgi:branched-chain amino acid transport system substrate-binding protein
MRGAQVWVKHINTKGGLNGHPVRYLVYDDGGDPARHRAQTQRAVETDHVISFLANAEAIAGATKMEYIDAKRIPVIGVSGGEGWAYSSPMYFPQGIAGGVFTDAMAVGAARYAVPKGIKKFGTLVCAEAPDCPTVERSFVNKERSSGYTLVYQGRASLAQPDYTAECLAARNAGAELLSLTFDPSSVNRISASCARQGYFPTYHISGAMIEDEQESNPNLDGTVGISNAFPYFQTGTPATDEFQTAMKSYGQGTSPGAGAAVGWTAGKLLEKAATNLPEPPTTAALLAGLWAIHGDSLGGLTYPLNFVENQKPERVVCWFTLLVRKGNWISPDGNKLSCE